MMMYLILPKAPGLVSLKKLLSHLNVNSLKKLKTESVNDEIFIILPKMKVDGKFSLTHPLLQQGISTMFNPSTANFTDMVHEVIIVTKRGKIIKKVRIMAGFYFLGFRIVCFQSVSQRSF